MTIRKLHGVVTDQDGCTQVARVEKSARGTKMAVCKLHGVETDQDGYTQDVRCID
jgi:hypothetical protein